MAAENIALYEQLKAIARRTVTGTTPMPPIIVSFGAEGTQYAATRYHRRVIQCRKWRPGSKSWTKWQKVLAGQIVRLATKEDRETYKPDYGPAWEENW